MLDSPPKGPEGQPVGGVRTCAGYPPHPPHTPTHTLHPNTHTPAQNHLAILHPSPRLGGTPSFPHRGCFRVPAVLESRFLYDIMWSNSRRTLVSQDDRPTASGRDFETHPPTSWRKNTQNHQTNPKTKIRARKYSALHVLCENTQASELRERARYLGPVFMRSQVVWRRCRMLSGQEGALHHRPHTDHFRSVGRSVGPGCVAYFVVWQCFAAAERANTHPTLNTPIHTAHPGGIPPANTRTATVAQWPTGAATVTHIRANAFGLWPAYATVSRTSCSTAGGPSPPPAMRRQQKRLTAMRRQQQRVWQCEGNNNALGMARARVMDQWGEAPLRRPSSSSSSATRSVPVAAAAAARRPICKVFGPVRRPATRLCPAAAVGLAGSSSSHCATAFHTAGGRPLMRDDTGGQGQMKRAQRHCERAEGSAGRGNTGREGRG